MTEQIGTEPKYDPNDIRDPMVKGYVNSALAYALQQKKPSGAVMEFSKGLGTTEFARFEQRYKVPAARLRHQLRSKNAGHVIEETREQLELLAKDLAKAEEYWQKIFSYVTEKYFKSRKSDIMAALNEAKWYPYLELNYKKQKYAKQNEAGLFYPSEYAVLTYFTPTDKKEKERYLRFEEENRADHRFGWLFLRNVFCQVSCDEELIDCIATENIQRVKIRRKLTADIGTMTGAEKVLESIRNRSPTNLAQKERVDKLAYEFNMNYSVFKMVEYNFMAMTNDRMEKVREGIKSAILGLEKEGFKSECIELRKLAGELPQLRELTRRITLYSPQAFYPIDFLPAYLASIYSLEITEGEGMGAARAAMIDTRSVQRAMTSSIIVGRVHPREREEYIRLAKVLGAKNIGEGLYIKRFG